MHDKVYFVPTHRPISSLASERHFREVQHAQRSCGVELPLVVVDDGESNQSSLAEWAARFPDVTCYYFTTREVTAIYDAIAARLPESPRKALRQIYPDGAINYGNVYNKLYVLAAVLGASQLHRRDSDTYAQLVPKKGGETELFPIELELRLLGQQVKGRPTLLVGGGYTGKWSIDIDHLIDDPDTRDLRRFFNCLSIPEHEHEVALQEHIIGNSAAYPGDKLEFDSDKEPDCGNMALSQVFEHLPCSPVRYALGSDYFTFACLIEANFSRAYHNRSVVHAHTPCRYDNWEKLVSYWRGTAALVVYQDFYRAYYCRFRPEARARLDGNSLEALSQLVIQSLREFREEFRTRPDTVRGRLSDFYEVIGKRGEPEVSKALDQIRAEEAGLVERVQSSVGGHLELMDAWHAIIETAKELRKSSEVTNAVEQARFSR